MAYDYNQKTEALMTYAQLCIQCVALPVQQGLGGIDLDIMAKRIRVIDAAEKAASDKLEHFDIEDADLQTLKDCVKYYPWTVVSL